MQFAPKRNGQQKSERALFYGPIKKDYERGMYVFCWRVQPCVKRKNGRV